MKAFSLILVLLALAQCGSAYSPYSRPAATGYSTGSSSYTSSSSSSSASSSSTGSTCCLLSSWAYDHIDEVHQFANRLRLEYNNMSQGSSTGYSSVSATPWNVNIINLTGKTSSELDALSRYLSEKFVTDMRSGLLQYTTIAQPNFFEWKAAEALQSYALGGVDLGQQQQIVDVGHYQPVDLSNYDEVKNYAYPAEVKVIDGKTYVVHKNCTEATKTSGDGTFDSPLITVLKRNHTVITTNNSPMYTTGVYGGNSGFTSGSMVNVGSSGYPGAYVQPSTTVTRKKTIYDWVNQNMEPSVLGYNPVVNVGSEWSSNMNSYQPPVHIPVDGGASSDVETFSMGNQVFRPSYNPGSTVTIKRYNKTIITNSDGTNTVHGSELNRKWVDGKLVYDNERPFGEWSVPRDADWKREERERFFWFLTEGTTTTQNLEEWQRQQEDRLLAMAIRYQTSIEEIQEWHRKELERYRILLGQYRAQSNDLTGWKLMERGRLDWLIHQNSVTREELERWQHDNQDKLKNLAVKYQISLAELKNWQIEELNRLYVYFNDQNNSMISRPNSDSLRTSEQERLDELVRQHNATIAQLQNSIKLDQQKLTELSQTYRGNVQDMEKWLKGELARLGGIITEQRNEMTRITEWQRSERDRLENIVNQHRGSVGDLEGQMARDRVYIQSLAAKYHVSIEELEKWQRAELERLHTQGQSKLEMDIKEWQRREREHLMSIINKNDLTIEEFQTKIMSDRARLEELAKTYKIQVSEVEEWIRKEIKDFQSQGLLKEVEKELAVWQQQERDRLLAIVQKNELTIEELQKQIKNDQSHLYTLAGTYQVSVEKIEDWLKKELMRLQSEGLIKVEDLKDWQRNERSEILKIVQLNKLTIEEFESKLLADRQRLQELSKTYNVQTTEIESWIKKEGERLQSLGLLKMQEQLNNWQKIERERLLTLINQNHLSIDELEEKIKKDRVHLYSLAQQHQVHVEEIEEWIKKEIKKLQQEGLIEMEKLKDWQTDWRGNLTSMVKERDFTVEEFHKWLLEDRARLQALAMQHNVQIEEIEQWVQNEEQRFVSMGLLKPNEKLTNWQEVERRYLERITQDQYHSTEQLEQRLRQDRELLEKLARDYSVQVEEIEMWMKKELARLRDDGQLQIDNLTSWQIAERERLELLTKQNKQWSVEEFEAVLRQDNDHMQKMAFQYHTSVEEIERWIQSEVERLRKQGKLDIQQLTEWQKTEQQRILNLLQQQSSLTVEEFEQKVQKDQRFLINLANQYHVSVIEVEEYVKQVIDDLREKGKFEVENLQTWQLVERDYIKQLMSHNNRLSTAEYEQKLLADRAHLKQLSDQYRINIEQIEKWMIEELKRLRKDSESQVQQLSAWQVGESQRLQELIKQNNHLSYVEFEIELTKERARLQDLAKQYSLSVEQIEHWIRQQLVNLKTTGQVEVESLTQWQDAEQKRLIEVLLQQQNNISFEEFEKQLEHDRSRLQSLSQQYRVSVEQIENWMRDELQRLKNSGLLQVEQLTYWQKIERDRLQDWLKQQNNAVSHEQFTEFLKRDKERLQRIATDYQLTVEEVESWVQQEGARLQILGMVQRPENLIYVEEYTHNWNGNNNNNNHMIVDNNNEEIWKVHTRAHLQAIAQVKPMNQQDFERYLVEERMRWEQFARSYNISVEEIEIWLRQAAKGIIHEDWESNEKLHIESLINEKVRKQQQWSIEELERQLKLDKAHVQQLALQYHVTVEQIEAWYKQELKRLLDQRRIISENLKDWQIREKDRIYLDVMRQPSLNLQSLERLNVQDQTTLNRLADEYHVSIEELEIWIRNELKRLVNLGLVKDQTTAGGYNDWQTQERERLRAIAAELTITEEELLEFISNDNSFQKQLATLYGCSLQQLAPFQRIEASNMQREGLFDNTKLLHLEQWQKGERDRLYKFIRNQNFSLKNLKDWQRQDMFLISLAAKYDITVQTLKDWQIQEYERLTKLAEYYNFTLNQLEDFRDKEWLYINYVMHKKTSSEGDRVKWGAGESKRMDVLEHKAKLTGQDLLEWRRTLYLRCQGLIPLDFGGDGHNIGYGSTNRTAIPQQIISKDRGDQPPNVHEETVDVEEPGLAGQDPLYPPPMAQMRMEPSTQRPVQYLPPARGPGVIQSGYRYSKTEYNKISVPTDGVAEASAAADVNGSSASASYGYNGGHHGGHNGGHRGGHHGHHSHHYHQRRGHNDEFNGMQTHALTMDNGQQQQEEVEDFGQQQQVDLSWNGHLTAGSHDDGQQQVQLEDFKEGYGGAHSTSSSASSHGSYNSGHHNLGQQQLGNGHLTAGSHDNGQQQVQLEDFKEGYGGAHSSSSSASSHGSYTSGHHNYGQQQQVEDFGQQQQVELDDYKQHDLGQQQMEVEDIGGSFATNHHSASEKQVVSTNQATANGQVEVVAEEEKPTGFFSKIKQKIFG